MKIFELFDTKTHVIPSSDNKYELMQSKKIGDNEIIFRADKQETSDAWEVMFYAEDKDRTTFDLTGAGHAAETMAFIIQSVRDLIEKRDPQTVYFSVGKDAAEKSRTKLYLRIIQRLMKDIHGYELSKKEGGKYDSGYVLSRIGT